MIQRTARILNFSCLRQCRIGSVVIYLQVVHTTGHPPGNRKKPSAKFTFHFGGRDLFELFQFQVEIIHRSEGPTDLPGNP